MIWLKKESMCFYRCSFANVLICWLSVAETSYFGSAPEDAATVILSPPWPKPLLLR